MNNEEKPYIARRENVLTWIPGGQQEVCPSINAAKRRSRALQKAGEKVAVMHVQRTPAPIIVSRHQRQRPQLKKEVKKIKRRPNWVMKNEEAEL